ncbi:MAG: DEAD/DEAH box helicase [Gemmatimonadaceae bacterium]
MTQAPRFRDHEWRIQYSSEDDDLLGTFYVPALRCAKRYDRATGYFNAAILRMAAEGIEHLVRNDGKMRLIVGCTLAPGEIAAIEQGLAVRDAIARALDGALRSELDPPTHDALELLAWMVAHDILDVKVAVPCDSQRRPVAAEGIFHDKSGILLDADGDRLAFNGSVNETAAGWTTNWESYDVFTSWQDRVRVENEARKFAMLWDDNARRVLLVSVPEAVRAELLRFLPDPGEHPRRLRTLDDIAPPVAPQPPKRVHEGNGPGQADRPAPVVRTDAENERMRQVWAFIEHAAGTEPNGMWVGPQTASVEPWPHQIRAYDRLWNSWPPRLLIADEVGLGKTVQAGLLLRQAWLTGRAKRMLVMAPKAVLTQWQRELREKFNLHWPIYDGSKLQWPESPAWAGRREQPVSRLEWLKEPFVLVSSHLVRRSDRAQDLLGAEPWDLVVLDEAHHARRKGAGAATAGGDKGPNAMLALMQKLAQKTKGLLLLTATPMQVHPVEVWDLLQLLGLPREWSAGEFLAFYDRVNEAPTVEGLEGLSRLFQALEREFGAVAPDVVQRITGLGSFRSKKLLSALRDDATLPRRQLSAEDKQAAYRFLRTQTPVRKLVSRHTRELLRRYYHAGKLTTRVADRIVKDEFVTMSDAERAVYEAVEDYITTTYNAAAADERNAVGFVMTIYRRRLASSFAALRSTLEKRLAATRLPTLGATVGEEDLDDDELSEGRDELSAGDVLSAQALRSEEARSLEDLLEMVSVLPPDTKLRLLQYRLEGIRDAGYSQVMVFTQYVNTMVFLRDALAARGWSVMTYSGEGGGVRDGDGNWSTISRDEAKRRFKAGKAQVMVCTDAAAEGLNFQFCGALVNYDMPWNPMRVEQRIGRIDRLGQKYEQIQIVNLHYADTVETDVYRALRERIGLFEGVVGKLQPILAQLPGTIRGAVLTGADRRPRDRAEITRQIGEEIEKARQATFDLDEDSVVDFDAPPPPRAPVTLGDLARLLVMPALLPPGYVADRLGAQDVTYEQPGVQGHLRVTADREFFEEHLDSLELWSPGGPTFPVVESDGIVTPAAQNLGQLLT